MKLRKMNELEFEEFLKLNKESYKQSKMRANGFTEKEAEKIASDDIARIIPDGYHSKNNFFFILESESLGDVGQLWYFIRGAVDNQKAYICDIVVHENCRGKGLGKKAMLELEKHVQAQGLQHIGLHVFGFNEAAIKLYQSLGYETTNLVMEKVL